MTTASLPAVPLFLKIGAARFPFPGAVEASAIYRATIERYDRETGNGGASGVPACHIATEADEVVGSVSYNGRVWAGDPRYCRYDTAPIYCPSVAA